VERHDAADTAVNSVLGEDGLDRLTPAEYRSIVSAADGDTLKERIAYAKLKVIELKGSKPAEKVVEAPKVVRRPDPGVSGGAGKGKQLTVADVAKMSPQEKFERRAEIAKLPLSL
jgi:hypothetical protein